MMAPRAEGGAPMSKTRVLINKDGVYYLTTGKLLTYDKKAAKEKEEEKGCEEVEKTFDRIKNEPHTWYQAVEIKDATFKAVNTGASD